MICLFPPTLCFSLPSSLPSPTDLFLFCLWLNFSRVSAGGSFGFTQDAASGSASAGGGGRLAFVFCLAFVCVFRYLFGFVCLRSPNRLGLVSTSEWGGDSLGFSGILGILRDSLDLIQDSSRRIQKPSKQKHQKTHQKERQQQQKFSEIHWRFLTPFCGFLEYSPSNIHRDSFPRRWFWDAQRFFAMRLLWLLCAASFFLSFSIFPLPKFFQDPSKILEEVSSEMAPFLSCSFISFYYYFHMIFREWGMLGDSSGFRFWIFQS